MCVGPGSDWFESPEYEPYKADEPCESYFGNVCSGFGGSLTCYGCGWDMYDHERGAI